MIRALCFGLIVLLGAGCASKVQPVQGQSAEQIERDRAECAAQARSASRGDLNLWPLGGVGWWPVDAALAGLGLIGGTVKYFYTHEKSVGELIDGCMLMKGYELPEKSTP
jgi:hypothetical protein